MMNKQPLFINAFARGGSNIIMNLLLSHPNVCISSGETHKVFKGTKWDSWPRKLKKRFFFDLPIRLYHKLSASKILNRLPYILQEILIKIYWKLLLFAMTMFLNPSPVRIQIPMTYCRPGSLVLYVKWCITSNESQS